MLLLPLVASAVNLSRRAASTIYCCNTRSLCALASSISASGFFSYSRFYDDIVANDSNF